MKILITGICGFVGSCLARALREARPAWTLFGLDNFSRPGSETNIYFLRSLGVEVLSGDIRCASDTEALPVADWVIDAAANPSVLAGVDGRSSSRQVVEHNLLGTINLLEYCRRHAAGFILLSTSRVYSVAALAALPVEAVDDRFRLRADAPLPPGISERGVAENFSVTPPVSLYGATKLASETLALEYGESFGFPVWINRCGVLAGAGQFGRADQGIVAYWINSYLRRQPLRYIGFGGSGHQVRDALHPRDLVPLLIQQMQTSEHRSRLVNVGGRESFSLASLHAWCERRFGFASPVGVDARLRPFDIPWMVMDTTLVEKIWNWQPQTSLEGIYEEISLHAEQHPDWLQLSSAAVAKSD